jgi:hypothetical protein
MAQCAAFCPLMNMAPNVGPMRGAPSSSATCIGCGKKIEEERNAHNPVSSNMHSGVVIAIYG